MINSFSLIKCKKKETVKFLILCSVIFIINPLLGILTLIIIIKQNESKEPLYYGLYALLALYLGLINSTKVPFTDLLTYKEDFLLSGSMNFKEYIFFNNKEIVFYFCTYLLYYILGGSFKLYVIVFTFIGYFIAFISLHKYWKSEDKLLSLVLFPVILLFLYKDTFFLSAHLVRQTLAGFLFIYFLIEKATNNKNKWLYLILAIFIHTSVVFMFLLCLIPTLSKKLSLIQVFRILIIITLIVLLALFAIPFLSNLTTGIDWLNYGFSRIQNKDLLDDTVGFFGANVAYFRVLYFLLLFIVLRDYFFGESNKKDYLVYNVFILFVISLEFLFVSGFEFLQMRMMVYLYLFTPFILPIIFKQNNFVNLARYRKYFQFIIIIYGITISARIFFTLDYFAPLSELLLNPVPFYFI